VNTHTKRAVRITVLIIVTIVLLLCGGSWVMPATGPPMPAGSSNEGAADLKACYSHCQRSILLNFDWCAQACRCALGYERCGPLPEGMEQS